LLETVGAALYRAGRYGKALELLTEAANRADGEPPPSVQFYLAVTHHRLGNAQKALIWLQRAKAQMTAMPAGGSTPQAWEDQLRWQLLRQESSSLLAGR
jgi:hypothetical protein